MKIKIVTLTVLLALSLGSCKKDFLETNPTGQVSGKRIEDLSKDVPSVAADMQDALMQGLYSWMYTPRAGGIDGNIDFGQKSIDLYVDILSGDMVKSSTGYGWYNELQTYVATSDKKSLYNYMPWRYFYRIIFTANGIIESLGGEDANFSNDEDGKALKYKLGQCLGMRGYAYFYLTQLFSAEYMPDEKLVPIYTDTKTVNHTVAPQKDVYNQAISDLKKAIELLKDYTPDAKYKMSKNVASAYLAYLYGAMGNNQEMLNLSASVMADKAFTPMMPDEIVYGVKPDGTKTGTGFNDVRIKGWIWGTDMNTDMGIDLYSWWGMCDYFTYSYASVGAPKAINKVLYDAIRPDDVRKNQFVLWDAPFTYAPFNKFYYKIREYQAQRNIDADYLYLRVSEMYLLHIEALAKLGKEADAKKELKEFLNGRIADLSYIDALNGDALLDEIYLQTRIEFFGEGKAFLAIKRFKKDLKFGDTRYDAQWQNQTMKYNDPRLHFMIPDNEEVNNPFLYIKNEK